MKIAYSAALLAGLASLVLADEMPRAPVSDPRPVMLAALQSVNGEAHGILSGEIADALTQRFAAMDLTEFYASIVPTLPNTGALQGSNAARLTTCYYGQGKCQ